MDKKEIWRRMRKSKFFMIGAFLAIFIVAVALIAPVIIAHDPYTSALKLRLTKPQGLSNGWNGYIMGTDAQGRDILTRLMIGSRVSMQIAFATVISTAILGTILGVIAGYYGGAVDNIIMRISDVQSAIPALILAIAVMAVLGTNIINLIIVLVLSRWINYTRIVRGSVMSIRNSEFVHASRILGASNFHIMFIQILPNVLTSLIIVASQQFGQTILTETALSFLGLGVPAPAPSWGGMISDGREYIATAPWVVVAPGIALMIAVLAFNFLGDGLRDVLDPKNKD